MAIYCLVHIPVRVEVRRSRDSSFVAQKESIIEHLLTAEEVDRLKQDMDETQHAAFASEIAAYVRRELFPYEASDSPIHLPETYATILVKGNITTWEKEPYLTN